MINIIYIIYNIMYIYIYTRNAWALPKHCSVEVSHSETHVDAISQNFHGKNNKGTREYWTPTPVKPYIPMGKTTKVRGNIKLPPQLNFTFNWEDQQRH